MSLQTTPPSLPLPRASPVRILVQSMTHLVPRDMGTDDNVHSDKLTSMLHRISRHHWGCPFWPTNNRLYTHGTEFGYNHRRCFFMIDHGEAESDAEVPVLCWVWDGGRFTFTPQLLLSKEVQDELKGIPFTPRPADPNEPPREKTPVPRVVRRRLREAQRIPDYEMEYMRAHPEEMEWLQRKVKPRFWESFVAQMEAMARGRGEEETQEKLGVGDGEK